MASGCRNWIESIKWQIDFYMRSNQKARKDAEFPWGYYQHDGKSPIHMLYGFARQLLGRSGLERFQVWFTSNAENLWEARSLLADDLSRLLFDSTLVLRLVGHGKYYFPRIDYDDLLEIVDEQPFSITDFPREYTGIPLRLFDIKLHGPADVLPMKVVATKWFLSMLNSYRQYLVRRDSIDIAPASGDIVFDCGACTGSTSVLFAGMVAAHGEVHLFDPVPLHIRFCRLQAALNPSLAHMFHINQLAVIDSTYTVSGDKKDSTQIEPGGLAINSYSSISLDEYTSGRLSHVDFIKMDIEGAEMEAIDGARGIIKEYRPRLAISAYHKPDDLWNIPIQLKSLNPDYRLYFGHHAPMQWESVVYAVQPNGRG